MSPDALELLRKGRKSRIWEWCCKAAWVPLILLLLWILYVFTRIPK